MSSPRITKLFEGMAEQLHRAGYAGAIAKNGMPTCIRYLGRDAAGKDAVLIDLDAQSWASGQKRVIIVATPAGTKPVDYADFHTQSHASGHMLDGSVALTVYMESTALASPANAAAALASQTGAQEKFQRDMLH